MAPRTKFRAFDASVVFNGANIFGEAVRADAFAYMAKNEIERIDRQNEATAGRPLPHRTFVDGVETTNLFRAKSDSRIEARWTLGAEIVEWIFGILIRVAPFSGKSKTPPDMHFRDSIRVYADGREISNPKDAVGAREVLLVSIVPYARKIERGQNGYAPGRVFMEVAALAKLRFTNTARIKFVYAEPEGPAPPLDKWAAENAAKEPTNRKHLMKHMKNRRNPAILIYL